MKFLTISKWVWLAIILSVTGQNLWACSTCYGAPDDPVTVGIQMAVMSMLGVLAVVLGAIATFMVSLWRKAQLAESEVSINDYVS